MSNVRVLVVDDSALVREILTKGLNAAPGLQVIGTAADAYQARDMIIALRPDVLTLDVDMPRMNGVEFLSQLMPQYPVPTIMVSALTERGQRVTLDALAAGAVDFVAKPRSSTPAGLEQMLVELRAKVRMAALARLQPTRPRAAPARSTESPRLVTGSLSGKLIVIGASTGGTEALAEVLGQLPANGPPVLIVQHMPAGFTRIFAERLDAQVAMNVREAQDGDQVAPGLVLIAPGERHMRIMRAPLGLQVVVRAGERVSGHCPSVDVLMASAAAALRGEAVGVILTGMGSDGARGLRAMRDAGAHTLAQDEQSCVVFGMPRVAWENGAAAELVPLKGIARRSLQLLQGKGVPA
jgi:two-component system chemotaxis response regulator CheB